MPIIANPNPADSTARSEIEELRIMIQRLSELSQENVAELGGGNLAKAQALLTDVKSSWEHDLAETRRDEAEYRRIRRQEDGYRE